MKNSDHVLNTLSEKEIVIINVGGNSNSTEAPPGPLFEDGTFKFIPIGEGYPGKNTPTYEELGLSEWVRNPKEFAHYDPEFQTMTFGDWKNESRASNAGKLNKGDFLFFFAALTSEEDRKKRKSSGMFLIGFFEIEYIIPYKEALKSPLTKNNAHVLRKGGGNFFSVWKGTERSVLLDKAIFLDKKNTNSILRTSAGELLPWGKINKAGRRQTDLETLNQHTRTSRRITKECRKPLWKLVFEKNPQLIKKLT